MPVDRSPLLHFKKQKALWVFCFSFLLTDSSNADVITFRPIADTTLIQTAPSNNLGGADFFNVGTTANNTRNRALLLFDLSAIPPGSEVNGASFSLEILRVPRTEPETSLIGLHRVLVGWGEGDKYSLDGNSPGIGVEATTGEGTWRDRFHNVTPWGAPGGLAGTDYVASPSSFGEVGTFGDPVFFDFTLGMGADLQFWINNPQANFGWILITDDELSRRTARSFASREHEFGPSLTIDFTPVPEPSTLLFMTLPLLAFVFRRRI